MGRGRDEESNGWVIKGKIGIAPKTIHRSKKKHFMFHITFQFSRLYRAIGFIIYTKFKKYSVFLGCLFESKRKIRLAISNTTIV